MIAVAMVALRLLFGSSPASAEPPLLRIRVAADEPADLAADLEQAGYDVMPRTTPSAPVDLVATEVEVAALRARGFSVTVLASGRPLAELPAAAAVEGYPTGSEIVAHLQATAAAYPEITRLVDLTSELSSPPTFNGQHLLALEISDHPGVAEDEPALLLLAGIHAREIANPALLLQVMDRLTAGYASDPAIAAVIDANRVWVAPLWNPDGYDYVFNVDNLWRKNRRVFTDSVGVDLNRNFPLGWDSACAGDSSPASRFYRGPAPASEAETQTLIAFSRAEQFVKVLELHSAGREVLWGWLCAAAPFEGYLDEQANTLAGLLGYAPRTPSADGEHYQWQLTRLGTLALLVETLAGWQPPYEEAMLELERLWPGILWWLERPLSITGLVSDQATGEALIADIAVVGLATEHGEALASEPGFGRYRMMLPPGSHTLRFSAPGYRAQLHEVTLVGGLTEILDVALQPSQGPDLDNDCQAPAHDLAGLSGPDPELPPGDWGCGCTSSSASSSDGRPVGSGGHLLLLVAVWFGLARRR